jgi:hypothetical protein
LIHVAPESSEVYTAPPGVSEIAASMLPSLEEAIACQLIGTMPLGTDAICFVQLRPESIEV